MHDQDITPADLLRAQAILGAPYRNSQTGVRGVSLSANRRFDVSVKHNGRQLRCGTYDTLSEAIEAAIASRLRYAPHMIDLAAKLATPHLCEICQTPIVSKKRQRFCGLQCSAENQRGVLRVSMEQRIWSKVRKAEHCWEWVGKRNPAGYGVTSWMTSGSATRQYALTHRVSWEMATGNPVPAGLGVLHACDNPPCLRNDDPGIYVIRGIARPRFGHLWLGTDADNKADMVEKGRQARGDLVARHGTDHWRAQQRLSR